MCSVPLSDLKVSANLVNQNAKRLLFSALRQISTQQFLSPFSIWLEDLISSAMQVQLQKPLMTLEPKTILFKKALTN